jgi:hypothetical protein
VAMKLHARLRVGFAIATTVLLTASAAQAADDKGLSVGGGIGLTASPTTFLMNFDLLYNLGHNFSLGPQLQAGVTSTDTIVSMLANARYDIDLSGDGEMAKFRPFVNGGIGFTYESFHPAFVSLNGTGFLIALGAGIEYRMNERMSLESAMQFNMIASGAGFGNADHFYWSWQMIGVRLRL